MRYRDVLGPEPSHHFYQAALEENRRLVEAETVELVTCAIQAATSTIWADVHIREQHVNTYLVSHGYAWARAWHDKTAASALYSHEVSAKAKGRGLWKAWCADRSRFGADDPERLFGQALRQLGIFLNPFNPSVGDMLARSATPFASAWVIWSLAHEFVGEDPGTPGQFYALHGGQVGYKGEYLTDAGWTRMSDMLSHPTESCGGVFLAAPENADIVNAARYALQASK